jgi:hypothetical protein
MELTDDEKDYHDVLQKLEDYHLAESVEQSPEWEVVRKAAKILLDETQAQYNAIDFSLPGADIRAVQCQVALGFYGDFFGTLLNKYRELGKEAYETAKEAGWLDKISGYLKKD